VAYCGQRIGHTAHDATPDTAASSAVPPATIRQIPAEVDQLSFGRRPVHWYDWAWTGDPAAGGFISLK